MQQYLILRDIKKVLRVKSKETGLTMLHPVRSRGSQARDDQHSPGSGRPHPRLFQTHWRGGLGYKHRQEAGGQDEASGQYPTEGSGTLFNPVSSIAYKI